MTFRSTARPVLAAVVAAALIGCAGDGDAERGGVAADRSAPPEGTQAAMTSADGDSQEAIDALTEENPRMDAPEPVPPSSGVEGRVTLGPRCPTVEAGQDCPDRPFSTGLVIRSAASGAVVATLESDAAGKFRVELEPGDYVIEPEAVQVVYAPSARPVQFSVEPGVFTRVDMRFDSGVR